MIPNNKTNHFQNTYYVPGTILSTSYAPSHLLSLTALWRWHYPYHFFTDEETETISNLPTVAQLVSSRAGIEIKDF